MYYSRSSFHPVLALLIAIGAAAGCASAPDGEVTRRAESALTASEQNGDRLFHTETFAGNGRTCSTCHVNSTGALSPEDVQAAFAADPNGPLFRAIDSDDGAGTSYERLLNHATIRVTIKLPDNVEIVELPGQRSITLNRGVPTVLNTPFFDPKLMLDGRAPNLETQAADAVVAHFEPGATPTPAQLEDIASFQKTLFSSQALADWASDISAGLSNGNQRIPKLPDGNTPLERDGAAIFQKKCSNSGFCHNTTLMNQTNFGLRFTHIRVSERNVVNNPVYTFVFHEVDKKGVDHPVTVRTPDPGRALITGASGDINRFKIPILWNIKNTAPYFHDNSAATLEDVMKHYEIALQERFGLDFPPEEQAAVAAWLRLL